MTASDEVRVLDTSALINFLVVDPASLRAILSACGGRFLVTDQVAHEARRHSVALDALCKDVFERVALGDQHAERFVEFTFRMHDGEASVLAYAESMAAIAVVDDSDAHLSDVAHRIEWSADLLLSERVRLAVPDDVLGAVLHAAGTKGRMRVHRDRWSDVIGVLGEERARECPGLRRAFRSRDWTMSSAGA